MTERERRLMEKNGITSLKRESDKERITKLEAENLELAARLDYVAMMTDVELDMEV